MFFFIAFKAVYFLCDVFLPFYLLINYLSLETYKLESRHNYICIHSFLFWDKLPNYIFTSTFSIARVYHKFLNNLCFLRIMSIYSYFSISSSIFVISSVV